MTEKRFKIINFLITENGFALTNEQATDRLNELFDENEQLKKENRSLIIELDAHKHIQHTKYEQIKKENEQLESDLQMSREKALYWRNKAENLFGDMRTNVELTRENKQLKLENGEMEDYLGRLEEVNEELKKELQKYTEIHFRNENGTHTVLYEKKE